MAVLDVEGQRQSVKDLVLALAAVGIIVSHIEEKSLLIVEMLVELQTVVYLLELSFTFFE